MEGFSDRLKMIEYLYQVAIDPMCYEDLLKYWDKVIQQSIAKGDETLKDQELFDHINRASAILGRLETTDRLPVALPLVQTIEFDPNPAVLLSQEGEILAANVIARTQLGLAIGKNILSVAGSNDIPVQKTQLLLENLAKANENSAGVVGLLELKTSNDEERVLLALSRVRCSSDARIAGLLTCLAPLWSKQTTAALRLHFDLTPAEIEIIQELVGGGNVSHIADVRNTSVHTVRSQVKSILLKTSMESQIDLIRHIGFMQRFEKTPRDAITASAANDSNFMSTTHYFHTLSTGMSMEYFLVGPEDGKPVLYIHGMVDSPHFPRQITQELFQRKILLVSPSRPGFGKSDPDRSSKDGPAKFARHVVELLDKLSIQRLPVFGHMAGSLYAYALAGMYPDRISQILAVAGTVPILSLQQIFKMSPSHRLVGLTAMHTPRLLPMFTKAGIALIRSGREDVMLNSALRDSPRDLELAKQPEIKAMLYHRYHFLSAQGHRAFQNDCIQVSSDWSGLMSNVDCPIVLVHGCHDQVVRIEPVRDFATTYGNCRLVEAPDSGQLVFSARPDIVLNQLEDLVFGEEEPVRVFGSAR